MPLLEDVDSLRQWTTSHRAKGLMFTGSSWARHTSPWERRRSTLLFRSPACSRRSSPSSVSTILPALAANLATLRLSSRSSWIHRSQPMLPGHSSLPMGELMRLGMPWDTRSSSPANRHPPHPRKVHFCWFLQGYRLHSAWWASRSLSSVRRDTTLPTLYLVNRHQGHQWALGQSVSYTTAWATPWALRMGPSSEPLSYPRRVTHICTTSPSALHTPSAPFKGHLATPTPSCGMIHCGWVE
jgi:hypothetical protein